MGFFTDMMRMLPGDALVNETIPGSYSDLSDSLTVWNPERAEQRFDFGRAPPELQAMMGKYTHSYVDPATKRLSLMGLQQPGGDKYDVWSAHYNLDPSSGQYVLDSADEQKMKSTFSKLAKTIGPVLAVGAAGALAAGAAGGGGAGGATGAGAGSSALGHGAWLGEGVASGIGAWDAAAGIGAFGGGGGAAGAASLGGSMPTFGAGLSEGLVGGVDLMTGSSLLTGGGGAASFAPAAGDVVEVVGERLPTSTLPSSPGGPPIGPSMPPLGPAPIASPVQVPPLVPPGLPGSSMPSVNVPGLPGTPNVPGTSSGPGTSIPGGSLNPNDLLRLLMGGVAMQQSDKYREMSKMPTLGEFQGMPGYAAAMDAVNRRQAASGTLRSGTADAAAASMGAGLYDMLYNQKLKQAAGYATGAMGLMSGMGLAGAGLGNLGTTLAGLDWGRLLGPMSSGTMPSGEGTNVAGGIDWAGMGANLGNLFNSGDLGGWGSDVFGPSNWPTGPGE